MKRTEITCPECMKKKLLDTGDTAESHKHFIYIPKPVLRCDGCGTEFIQTGEREIVYR